MISEKELLYVQSALAAENLLFEKFGAYAAQASDPQLKELFSRVQQDEQRHHSNLAQFLNQVSTTTGRAQ
ncbi:MAG: ferritin-like domain-containing protein [Actinobacteria bacterium]|nr:ferritin-like domain-containing protein [Actinomycetota bacterium]